MSGMTRGVVLKKERLVFSPRRICDAGTSLALLQMGSGLFLKTNMTNILSAPGSAPNY
jgi:hypothetical protein